MFRKWRLISSLFIATVSSLWLFHSAYIGSQDWKEIRSALEKEKSDHDLSMQIAQESTSQTRQKVRKEIWISEEEGKRLHYRIESNSSLLTLQPKGKKMEIVENLNGIRCWMQDKLFLSPSGENPMQQVRFFEADHGIYRYNAQQFTAESVSLSLLRLTGHILSFDVDPKSTFLKGLAKNVSFSLAEGTPQFQADQFNATLKGTP